MGRKPCCSKEGLNRGAWNAHEDNILVSYIKAHGEGHWGTLPIRAGLKRCGKSCRLRWLNYLRPGIKRGNISDDEEDLIIRLHKLLGNRWSLIAGRLPGRTDNEIKNYWNTTLMKRVQGRPHKPSKPKSLSHPNGKKDADTTATAPSSCSPRPPHESEGLIRTKALRCTRTFFYQPEGAYPPNPAQANGVKGSESSYHAACIFGAAMDDPANALPTCADAATDLNSWGPVVDEVVPWDRDVGGAVDLGFCSEDVALDVAELDNWMEDYWCFQPDSGLNAQSLDSLLDLEDPYWI